MAQATVSFRKKDITPNISLPPSDRFFCVSPSTAIMWAIRIRTLCGKKASDTHSLSNKPGATISTADWWMNILRCAGRFVPRKVFDYSQKKPYCFNCLIACCLDPQSSCRSKAHVCLNYDSGDKRPNFSLARVRPLDCSLHHYSFYF